MSSSATAMRAAYDATQLCLWFSHAEADIGNAVRDHLRIFPNAVYEALSPDLEAQRSLLAVGVPTITVAETASLSICLTLGQLTIDASPVLDADTEAVAATPPNAAAEQDGPVGENRWRCGGRVVKVGKRQLELLSHLWRAGRRRPPFSRYEVQRAMYRDEVSVNPSHAFSRLISLVNDTLKKRDLGMRVVTDRDDCLYLADTRRDGSR